MKFPSVSALFHVQCKLANVSITILIHSFQSQDQLTDVEAKTADQDSDSYQTSRRDTAKFGKISPHSYLDHLSTIEKEVIDINCKSWALVIHTNHPLRYFSH